MLKQFTSYDHILYFTHLIYFPRNSSANAQLLKIHITKIKDIRCKPYITNRGSYKLLLEDRGDSGQYREFIEKMHESDGIDVGV